jgi:hypothetical protein
VFRKLRAVRVSVTVAVAASLVGASCLASVPASAATAAPTLRIAPVDPSAVIGEKVPVHGFLSQSIKGAAVRLQEESGSSWAYVGSAVAKTGASGEAAINFIGGHSGARTLRLVTVINGKQITSSTTSISVYADSSSSPTAPKSVTEQGDQVDEVNTEMCESIAHVVDDVAAYGAEDQKLIKFIASFSGSTITAQVCDNKSMSEAVKEGLTEALWDFAKDYAEDAAAKTAWGPVLDIILDPVGADDIKKIVAQPGLSLFDRDFVPGKQAPPVSHVLTRPLRSARS